MELHINKEHRIRTDEYNVILEKRRISTKGNTEGQEVWDTVGNYSDFDCALSAMLKYGILRSDLHGVIAIVDAIKKVEETIKVCLSEANLRVLDKQMRKLALENEILKKKCNKIEAGEGE